MSRRLFLSALLVSSALSLALPEAAQAAPPADRPNVLVILADDLGYSDLGAFGGEIRTPNLDALINQGVRFTDFHTTPVCSPTRAELLTGVDHHRTGLGNFTELMQPNQRGNPGYEGYLNEHVVTIADRMRAAGYLTLMSGKWHVGNDPRADPYRRGFEHSYALLAGGHDHFNDGTASARMVLPDQAVVRPVSDAPMYTRDGKADRPGPFYSSDYFTDQLIGFLPDRASDQRPVFAYLAFTAPHYPLQAPAEDIERYRGAYDEGYDVLRERRLKRQIELGLLAPGAKAHPVKFSTPWSDLTAEQRRYEARKMEVYAAMVDRLDQNVGRLVSALKAKGLYDNTIIFFLSDNGAEGSELDKSVIMPGIGKAMLASGDNRLESVGGPGSYMWYGPGWAQAATAPARLFKSFTTEGGTRVPAFVSGVGVKKGQSPFYLSVRDILPTVAELAGVSVGGTQFAGRTVLEPTGRSFAGVLGNPALKIHAEVVTNGEAFGRRFSRKGKWKAVHTPPPTGSGRWELFDLEADPNEVTDLSASHGVILNALIAQWDAYATVNGVVLPTIPGN